MWQSVVWWYKALDEWWRKALRSPQGKYLTARTTFTLSPSRWFWMLAIGDILVSSAVTKWTLLSNIGFWTIMLALNGNLKIEASDE